MMPLAKMIVHVLALFLAASTLVGCAGAPRAMSEQSFAQRVAAHEAQSLAQRDEIAERLLRRLEYRLAEQQSQGRSHEPFTYEVLMLSSGGQFGAFGVGVLQGWSEVQDSSFQRPELELLARDLDTEADFFYLAVPYDLELPAQTQRLFDPKVMQMLAAEGSAWGGIHRPGGPRSLRRRFPAAHCT